MRLIEQHKTTLVFCNTRGLAELIFQDLWEENEQGLPIGIHHGSLAVEARRKVEAAMAAGKLRGLVATASLDLGIDWGDVDLVVQMGAPKGSSRLLQRIGRANHRLDEPSKGIIVPGNRFEYLEARAALDAIDDGELDPEMFRPGALDVLAQHILGDGGRRAVPAGRAARRDPLGRALCRAEATRRSRKSSISSPPAAMRSRPTTASAGWCPSRAACGASPGRRSPSSTASTPA